MIESTVVKIKRNTVLETSYIEQELSKLFDNVIRYAVVEITDNDILLNVSYEK